MIECPHCHAEIKRPEAHWRKSPACYAAAQKELARQWKRRQSDMPGCYRRTCEVCAEHVYSKRPETRAHTVACLMKLRAQPVAADDPKAKPCDVCSKPMIPTLKRRYCSDRCQQRAYRGKGTEGMRRRLEKLARKRQAARKAAQP